MSHVLTYTVINSRVAVTETEIDYQGQPATIKQTHTYLEAAPVDAAGKTLSLVLPAELAEEFADGATITVTLQVVEAD